MSAYAHQMEREYSNQSLSTGGGSEMGSRYVMESGFYVTSFAATIFIAALLIVGLLLITLPIALIVMLQSCESRSGEIVEISKSNGYFNYCKIFSLHAELNRLDMNDFPEICKITTARYIKEGQYARDLNLTMWVAENYFSGIKQLEDGLDLVLMDIDDLVPSSSHYIDPLQSRFSQFGCDNCLEETKNLKRMFILKLYTKLQAGGWPLILFSRKPEKQQNATVEHLVSAGYRGWSSLVMRQKRRRESSVAAANFFAKCKYSNVAGCGKSSSAGFWWLVACLHTQYYMPCNHHSFSISINLVAAATYYPVMKYVNRLDDEMQMDSREYFSRLRNTLQKQGFRIAAVVSSQMDALTDPCAGTRMFKLPNPIYHNVEHYIVSSNLPQ